MAQDHLVDARSDFQRAIEICPQAAEAQFRLGKCLLQLTNGAVARSHFLKAVDADTLPFRADSRINESIRAAARKFSNGSLVLCDAAEMLGANSQEGVPGAERFYDHVHLNSRGNYELALAWAGQVEKLLSPAIKGAARPLWVSQSECEQLLGLTDWNRVSVLEEVLRRLQRPPFSGQLDNTQQVARLRVEIEGLKQRLTSEAASQARGIYLRALRRAPENYRLHENYAEFLEDRHELPAAIVERRKVCELIPPFYFPHYALGVDLKEAGQLSEARAALLKADALKPDEPDVRLELGIVSARQGDWETARREMELAQRSGSGDPRVPLYLGEVLWKLNRHGDAVAALREAIRLSPGDWQPRFRLAYILAQAGNFSEAASEYQEALRLNPTDVRTKIGLAKVLLNLRREPEGLKQLNEALQLEPANESALELQRQVRGW